MPMMIGFRLYVKDYKDHDKYKYQHVPISLLLISVVLITNLLPNLLLFF